MLERLVALGLGGLWLLLLFQVLARYVLPVAPVWTEEVARLVFVYLVFAAASLALWRGQNMQVTTLVDGLPPVWRRGIRVGVLGASGVFLLVVLVWSFVVIPETWGLPLPATDLPTGLFFLPVPGGAIVMLAHVAKTLRQEFRRGEPSAGC